MCTRRIPRVILITVIVLLLVYAVIQTTYFNSERFKNSEKLTLNEVEICTTNIFEENKGNRSYCGKEFPSSTEQLYVCGNMTLSEEQMDPGFSVYKNGEKYPIHDGWINKRNNNHFCQALLPLGRNQDRDGLYTLKIEFRRRIVANIEFQIK